MDNAKNAAELSEEEKSRLFLQPPQKTVQRDILHPVPVYMSCEGGFDELWLYLPFR
jgi:hypothetical protein